MARSRRGGTRPRVRHWLSWLGGTLLAGSLIHPIGAMAAAGVVFLLMGSLQFKFPAAALVVLSISLRSVSLGGNPRESLLNLYDPIIVVFCIYTIGTVVLNARSKRRRAVTRSIVFGLCLFGLSLMPSLVVSQDPKASVVELGRFILCIGVFLAITWSVKDSPERMQAWGEALRFALKLSIVLALADVVGQVYAGRESMISFGPVSFYTPNWLSLVQGGAARATGLWGDPNYLGAFVGTGMMTFALASPLGPPLEKVWMLLGLLCVVLVKSGTLLLASVSCVFLLLLWSGYGRRGRRRVALACAVVGGVVGTVAVGAGIWGPVGRFMPTGTLLGRPVTQMARSFTNRIELWQRALAMWRGSMAFGNGLGTFKILVNRTLSWPVAPPVHNSYLELLQGGGVVAVAGLVVFLSLIMATVRHWRRALPGVLAGLVFLGLVGMMFDLLTARASWVFLGLAVGAAVQSESVSRWARGRKSAGRLWTMASTS